MENDFLYLWVYLYLSKTDSLTHSRTNEKPVFFEKDLERTIKMKIHHGRGSNFECVEIGVRLGSVIIP